MYTIEELLFYIDYWINHAYTLKSFMHYTFLTVEDKEELVKLIELSKEMAFRYIRLLIHEVD